MNITLDRFDAASWRQVVPTETKGQGHLYCVDLGTGLVKVGRARRVRDRMYMHVANYGELVEGWVSPAHGNYAETESALLAAARSMSTEVERNEYFYGVSVDQLADVARQLHYAVDEPLPGLDPPVLTLTQAEAARRLGVSRWTVGRMLRSGELHGVQVSRRTRVPASEVARVLERQGS